MQVVVVEHNAHWETGHGMQLPLLWTCPAGQTQLPFTKINPWGQPQLAPLSTGTKGLKQEEQTLFCWQDVQEATVQV